MSVITRTLDICNIVFDGYRIIVLAPNSVQEMYDLTMLAFDLSDIYRIPAMVLADSVIGQMNESITANPWPQPYCRR